MNDGKIYATMLVIVLVLGSIVGFLNIIHNTLLRIEKNQIEQRIEQ